MIRKTRLYDSNDTRACILQGEQKPQTASKRRDRQAAARPRPFGSSKCWKRATSEVALTAKSMNHRDCFVLDNGTAVYTWYGENASPFIKAACISTAHNIADDRNGQAQLIVEPGAEFWGLADESHEPIVASILLKSRPAVRTSLRNMSVSFSKICAQKHPRS